MDATVYQSSHKIDEKFQIAKIGAERLTQQDSFWGYAKCVRMYRENTLIEVQHNLQTKERATNLFVKGGFDIWMVAAFRLLSGPLIQGKAMKRGASPSGCPSPQPSPTLGTHDPPLCLLWQ